MNTTAPQGASRLRRVAKLCEGYGQRVQYSLFEVTCDRTSLARLMISLEEVMEPSLDSIRVYPLDRDGFSRVVRLGVRRELPEEHGWIL